MKMNKAQMIAWVVVVIIGIYLLTTSHNVFGQGLLTGAVILPILDYIFASKKK